MKIDNISNIKFKSTNNYRRYLSQNTQENAGKLLNLMGKEIVYTENEAGTSWTTKILASLNIDNEVKFTDNRTSIATLGKIDKAPLLFSLQFGKTTINANAGTGEIVSFRKSFFQSWSSIIAQSEVYLKILLRKYLENDIEKGFFSIGGYTQKGIDVLKSKGLMV